MAARNVISPYFVALQNGPCSIVSVKTNVAAMAVNNNNNSLLYCPEGSFVLIDEQRNEIFNIQRKFKVSDMCFSSLLNQFLILSYNADALYSLDSSTHVLKKNTEFNRTMWSCTCYDKTFIVTGADNGARIEIYDLCADQWNPIRSFTTLPSCEADHQIEKIRFNSDGSRVGMILRQGSKPNYYHWFELRDPNDMTVILKTNIHPNNDEWCWFIALPNQQFLATLWRQKRFFLFDSDGKLEETAGYNKNVKYLNSIALVNDRYLAVQTWKPDELHFYEFKT